MFIGFNEKVENWEDNRLAKIENILTEHNKSISLANNELASIKNSILNIINDKNKSSRDFDELGDQKKFNKEKEISILSSQIFSIIKDFSQNFKQIEKAQRNFRNIIEERNLEAEKSDILENSKNSELETELKGPQSAYEGFSSAHETSVAQDYQDIVSTYKHKTSLFNLVNKDERTNLLIFNPETGSQELKILDAPQPLGKSTCITQLPNGKLFCFGNYPPSGKAFLIDESYRVQELPSGTACSRSSAIFFNNNIYCFGGYNGNRLALSSRFDLDRNQWNELTPLPNADSSCNSILFNGSILISGYENKNLLRYSIDSNSFLTIPYDFTEKQRKILINSERLYLIECINGSIYESEIGNDTAWRQIANNSNINFLPGQTYCQYYKEEIYIGCISGYKFWCFKFNLNKKKLIKLV